MMKHKRFLLAFPLLALALLLIWPAQRAGAQTAATNTPAVSGQTATPLADGSIVHVVQPGEGLWSIAILYGVKVDTIKAYNNLGADGVIYENQKLLIRLASTPTTTPTITQTSPPPTRTPRPTRTERPPAPTRTPAPTLAPSETASLPQVVLSESRQDPQVRRMLGIGLIVVCAAGAVLVIASAIKK